MRSKITLTIALLFSTPVFASENQKIMTCSAGKIGNEEFSFTVRYTKGWFNDTVEVRQNGEWISWPANFGRAYSSDNAELISGNIINTDFVSKVSENYKILKINNTLLPHYNKQFLNGTITKIIRSLDFEIYESSFYTVSTAPNGFQKVITNSREECWDPSRK